MQFVEEMGIHTHAGRNQKIPCIRDTLKIHVGHVPKRHPPWHSAQSGLCRAEQCQGEVQDHGRVHLRFPQEGSPARRPNSLVPARRCGWYRRRHTQRSCRNQRRSPAGPAPVRAPETQPESDPPRLPRFEATPGRTGVPAAVAPRYRRNRDCKAMPPCA